MLECNCQANVSPVVRTDDVIPARLRREGSLTDSIFAHTVKVKVRVDGNQEPVLPHASLIFCCFDIEVLVRVSQGSREVAQPTGARESG